MTEVEIDGVKRDLSHLQEFIISIAGKGKDGSDLRVAVTLSNHTVSTKCARGSHNILDENGKPRLFCETRYAFSLGLQDLAKRMLEQNYFCWESRDQNRSANYAIIDVEPGCIREIGNSEHQIVYFYLYPSKKNGSDVSMVVVSCHKRRVVLPNRRFNVLVLLRKCFYDQKRVP
jgi:hypothetical protein